MKPTDDDAVVPTFEIDWYRSVPWWHFLSRSITISWRATHLLACALAIFLCQVGWDVGVWAFQPGVPVSGLPVAGLATPVMPATGGPITGSLNAIEFATSVSLPSGTIWASPWSQQGGVGGVPLPSFNIPMSNQASPLVAVWSQFVQPIARLVEARSINQFAFIVFLFLWTAAVWSLVGGVIARRSVVEFGTRSTVGWLGSLQLVARRWSSLMWCLAMPLIGCCLLAVAPLLLGLISRLGMPGQFVAGLGMIPAILFAVGIGWLVALAAFGFPLMVVSIVTERNADAFDGFSRTGAYLFQRPMTLAIAIVVGSFACIFSQAVAGGILYYGGRVVWFAFETGSGRSSTEILSQGGWGTNLLYLANYILSGLIRAIPFSFFWTAAAAVYLTLRFEVDRTNMDDLDLGDKLPAKPLAELETQPAERHEAGVADGVDAPASEPT